MGIGSIIGSITGAGAGKVIESTGAALDGLFTSDAERLSHAEIMERLRQRPDEAQIEVNKIHAASSKLWDSGWRPYIGWSVGTGVAYEFVFGPICQQIFSVPMVKLDTAALLTLLGGMLGMSSIRTIEKKSNINK